MMRYLKPVALIFSFCIISYLSYLAGTYRNLQVIENIYSKNVHEFELGETRHDERIVQALADGNKEAIFSLVQYRYFLRILFISEELQGEKSYIYKNSILKHISKAQALHKKLSFKFLTEEENKRWAALTTNGQPPN